MKTHIITLSKVFLQGHPRAGQPTNFRESFEAGKKIHTIRGNVDYWANIVDEVNAGRAVLHIKQWIGKPYRTKQELVAVLDKDSGIGYQKILMDELNICIRFGYTKYLCGLDRVVVARNDGLSFNDFFHWFFPLKKGQSSIPGIIIHFTKFRY